VLTPTLDHLKEKPMQPVVRAGVSNLPVPAGASQGCGLWAVPMFQAWLNAQGRAA
jgi:hypothetical protein